jgi:hypothetical protein
MRELDPIRMSNELLHHLNAGDKVAIISRFPDKISNFTATLQRRGLQVRTITGQNGVQDFSQVGDQGDHRRPKIDFFPLCSIAQ